MTGEERTEAAEGAALSGDDTVYKGGGARNLLDLIEPCQSIDADLAALTEGFCPACHGRLTAHGQRHPHVRCAACDRCMENLTQQWREPVYSTWAGCADA